MNAPLELPLSAWLRAATRADHARVDAAYAGHDLATPAGYGAFLSAHARVLPALEALLRPGELLAGWRGRAADLHADLAAMGQAIPATAPTAIPTGAAARWGAIYVLEGSRLGGAMLARLVPQGMPRRFLAATHGPGEWRALLARLDAAAADRRRALAGAQAAFAAFTRAAGPVRA